MWRTSAGSARSAKLFTEAGLITLVSFISPFRSPTGSMARDLFAPGEFVEIHVDMRRWRSAETARSRRGSIAKAKGWRDSSNFTGIDSPYEAPEQAEIHLMTSQAPAEMAAERVVDYLREHRLID